MADYFTHFSCLLDVGAPEKAALALDLYNALSAEGASEDPPSEGFLLSIQPEHGGTNLWMRDDGAGDPERVIQFVKRCATAFHLSGLWGFQYANSCSKCNRSWPQQQPLRMCVSMRKNFVRFDWRCRIK